MANRSCNDEPKISIQNRSNNPQMNRTTLNRMYIRRVVVVQCGLDILMDRGMAPRFFLWPVFSFHEMLDSTNVFDLVDGRIQRWKFHRTIKFEPVAINRRFGFANHKDSIFELPKIQ